MANGIPNYGWKVKLNNFFPEKRNQNFTPSLKIIFSLLPLIIRYLLYTLWCYIRRRKPVMDYIKIVEPKQMYGVPLGGIGGGTIGRGFRGEFCRFQLKSGIYEYKTVDADQFIVTVQNCNNVTIYQNVLSVNYPPVSGHLNLWKWNFPADHVSYSGLYPRSWTEYDIPECNIKLICRQISPVIPKNYKDSSLPGVVFVWNVQNYGPDSLNVTITFTLKGHEESYYAEPFDCDKNNLRMSGVTICNFIGGLKCDFTFAAKETKDVLITSRCFNPNSSGMSLWDQLKDSGSFKQKLENAVQYFGEIACAVSAKVSVPEKSSKDLEFAFVWHMPFIRFHNQGKIYERYYTKFFGSNSSASVMMCHYALSNFKIWEEQIENWQNPVLNDNSLPDWYKSAIFNELYFISDGGTIWVQLDKDDCHLLPHTDPRREYGRFAYLEGHEYRMYNTYDVHFYASFALADLWPMLQYSIQYEFRDAVMKTDKSWRWFLYDGHFGYRKKPCSIPHDIGDPEEEPFVKIDAYPVHDVSDWKDLNLKFVLQCYRDFIYTNNDAYLKDMWPEIKLLMNHCLKWDTDCDGMIENSCYPDQTYDTWKMTGISAYCGSLWLAALCMTVKMALIVEDAETEKKYSAILEKAKIVFNDKLWNGNYYNFDTGEETNSKTIMADQLCGLWYLEACGVSDEVLPRENVLKALRTIFEFNVKKFKNGESGAVNGMLPTALVDKSSVQSQEVWTGVSYGLASHFIFQGMKDEGLCIAEGVYETVYNKAGLAFDTPEALYETDYIRSVGYMRPLSIWSIQMALQKSNN